MTTIQDVARQAAVSVSTVSNVLNGRTPLIGLLVPSITNPMYGYIAREIETVAQEKFGFRLLIGSTYRDREKESAFFEDLLSHGVRRVIVISSLADERHFESAVQRGMVVVSYDRGATPGKRSSVGHVMPDNFAAAKLATRHLIKNGHKQLAFATVAGMTMSRSAKIDGFYAAVDAAGLRAGAQVLDGGPIDEYGDSMIAEVGRAMALQIAQATRRPSGIVALNDLMALGLMAGLREAGLHVPRDVSVVGIDGHFLATLSNPMLTTVQLPVPEMAQAMVDRAMNLHPDPDQDPRKVVFAPTRLVQRESVAPPAAAQRGRVNKGKPEQAAT